MPPACAERAIAEEAHSMLLPLSASHAHSLANLRKTPDEVVAEIARIRAARDAAASARVWRWGSALRLAAPSKAASMNAKWCD
jgi:hypothetical protein